jgi:hypothetical protein
LIWSKWKTKKREKPRRPLLLVLMHVLSDSYYLTTSNDIVMHRGDDFVKPAHGHITTASLLCGPVHTMTCYACLYEYTSCLITALLLCYCCLPCSFLWLTLSS